MSELIFCSSAFIFTDVPKFIKPSTFKDIQYLLYSRVPKCGSETTLALMANTSMINNISMEVHQNVNYFEHQWFKVDSENVSQFYLTVE